MNNVKELQDDTLMNVAGGENPNWSTYKIKRGNVFFGTYGSYYTANEDEGDGDVINVQFFYDNSGNVIDTLDFPVAVLKTFNFFAQSDSRFPPKEC